MGYLLPVSGGRFLRFFLRLRESGRRRFLAETIPRRSVGAEIGVHEGDFSRAILDIVDPEELHLIDPWRHEAAAVFKDARYGGLAKGGQQEMDARCAAVRSRFAREVQSGRVRIHRGASSAVLERFPDAYFDWVYIDGNHLYEHVKVDIALSLRKTKAGGIISGDDYAEGGWWDGGVKRAVDELARYPAGPRLKIFGRQFVLRWDGG